MRTTSKAAATLAGLALMSVPTLASAATHAGAGAAKPTAAPQITWTKCTGSLAGLDCGTMTVPLDYAKPAAGTFTVAITKRPAAKASKGAIFYGAPGLAANPARALTSIDKTLGTAVTDSYDILAVAPRGVGGSSDLKCIQEVKGWPVDYHKSFPTSAADRALHFEIDAKMVDACKATMPAPITNMTTAESARDLDLARQAVGAKALNFYGGGYSSVLAAQYTQLFPKTVGRIALGSALDPVAYSTGRTAADARKPVTERINTGAAAQASWRAIVKACVAAGPEACEYASTISSDFTVADAGLRKEAFGMDEVYLPYDLTVDTFIEYLNGDMASLASIPDGVEWVHAVADLVRARDAENAAAKAEAAAAKTPGARSLTAARSERAKHSAARVRAAQRVAAAAKALDGAKASAPVQAKTAAPKKATARSLTARTLTAAAPADDVVREDVLFDTSMGLFGVMCTDAVNPKTQQTWTARDYFVRSAQGGFGQLEMWNSSPCALWPAGMDKGAYRGDYSVKPANGVLVVANEFDPKMPLSGAKAFASTIAGSRLVTVKGGFGSSPVADSAAAKKAVSDYLTGGAMPAADLAVAQEVKPFS